MQCDEDERRQLFVIVFVFFNDFNDCSEEAGVWETTGPAIGTGRLPPFFLSSPQVVLTKVVFSQGDILDTHPLFSLHPHEWVSERERENAFYECFCNRGSACLAI